MNGGSEIFDLTGAELRLSALLLRAVERLSEALERILVGRFVDCVPRPEVLLTVRSAPLRMASTMRASAATFLIQAPSFWV